MAETQDDMQNLPDWVQVVLKFGVPSAIACYLVFRLAGGLDVVDVRLRAVEEQHATQSARGVRIESLMEHDVLTGESVLLVLRQICVQNAHSPSERRDCFQGMPQR